MGAAADVEKQAVRRIERHQRRETIAPFGDIAQHPGIGRFIRVEHLQMRTDGARIGKRQADIQAKARRRIVERDNLQRVVLFGDNDAGLVARRGACVIRTRDVALDTIDGQARQPQAENPPSLP